MRPSRNTRVDALSRRALYFEVIDLPGIGRMLKLAIAARSARVRSGLARSSPRWMPGSAGGLLGVAIERF
jgi:hypothetical protein